VFDFKDPKFKKMFWEWFDGLHRVDRMKFQYYPADTAELYFYNKVYRHLPEEKLLPESLTG
jgi:hypothetical protein